MVLEVARSSTSQNSWVGVGLGLLDNGLRWVEKFECGPRHISGATIANVSMTLPYTRA